MQKVLASLFMVGVLVALQIAVNIYGWGLTPKNWWWIIGVGVVGIAFVQAFGEWAVKD